VIAADTVWDEFLANLDEVRRDAGVPAETVHRVRSTASRLCAWLELGGHRALRDDLRWVRRRAAPLRDADVALAGKLPAAMAEWLAVERLHRRDDFAGTLSHPRLGALRSAMPLLPPLSRGDAEPAMKSIERRVQRRSEAVSDDAPAETIHRLRRAVRRLRNARDWLGVGSGDLRPALDAFGGLNDTVALLHLAQECPAGAVPAEFTRELRARLETQRRRAIDEWRRTEASRRRD
jgi:CHAD domain-containing protein